LEITGRIGTPFNPENIGMGEYDDTITEVFRNIYRGSMPKMITDTELSVDDYYGSYMQTYLERGVSG
jgi:hypothetical protein